MVENLLANYNLDYDMFPTMEMIVQPFAPIINKYGSEFSTLLMDYFGLIMAKRSADYWNATPPSNFDDVCSMRQRLSGWIADAAGEKIAPLT